jgi:hypothetical protein
MGWLMSSSFKGWVNYLLSPESDMSRLKVYWRRDIARPNRVAGQGRGGPVTIAP